MPHKKVKLFLLPYPPPYAGPEIIAKEILESETIKNKKDIIFINGNIRKKNGVKGKFDLSGILKFLGIYFKYLLVLFRIKTIFIYLASSRIGFLKDSIYIVTAWLFNKKIISQYHGSNFDNFYRVRNNIYKKWINFSLSKLDKLLILGSAIKENFQGIYRGKLHILGNGLNFEKYPPKKIYDTNSFTIFFMGHLIYSKGIYDLIDAYKILYKKYGKKINLIIAGENIGFTNTTKDFVNKKWRENFFLYASSKNKDMQKFIHNDNKWNVKYLGFVTGHEKIKVFQKSDIFVLPSYSEGFSMACLEAMAIGLPVITTPVGAMPHLVKNKINGLITEISNPEKLVVDIEFFINNREEVEKMGSYNAQYVRKNFNIEIIAKQLINILEDRDERN